MRRREFITLLGGAAAALAAKAATATIPIVFGVAEDPTHLGLVSSLARPGRNATGINFFSREVVAHDLPPKALRVAVLLNPKNAGSAAATLRDVQEAAPVLGLQIQILDATTVSEINAAPSIPHVICAHSHPCIAVPPQSWEPRGQVDAPP
jgi:putative ABC transport system substrate-binding protein